MPKIKKLKSPHIIAEATIYQKPRMRPAYRCLREIIEQKESVKRYYQDMAECDALELGIEDQIAKNYPAITKFFETLTILKKTKNNRGKIAVNLRQTAQYAQKDFDTSGLKTDERLIKEIRETARYISSTRFNLENSGDVSQTNFYEREKPISILPYKPTG